MLATHARADRIVFRDGRTVEGRVISETDTRVVVETNSMRVEFNRSSIAEVIMDEPWTNLLLDAEGRFRASQPDRGIEGLLRAMTEGAPVAEVSRVMQQYHHSISTVIRSSAAVRRGEINFALQRLMASDQLTTPTLFRVSQHFYQLEDYSAAATALRPLTLEDLAADPMKRSFALELMRFLIRRQLRRGEFEQALQWLEDMRRLAENDQTESLPLALLAAAGTAREQGRFGHAISILAHDLHPRYPEIARNRLVYTVDVLKHSVETSRDYANAIAAIEPLVGVFPLEHAAALNHFVQLAAGRALENDEPRRASELIEKVREEVRSPELVRIYNRAYHDERIAELGESDPLALVELGRWCMEHDMLHEAMSIFQRTRSNPSLREVSNSLLVTLRRDRDTRLLEQAHEAYELGQLGDVIHITLSIINDEGVESALEKEAKQLRELAESSLKREREANPYRAEVLFQNAERAYFSGNLEEAYHLIRVVIRSYEDTPAAKRANDLLPSVLRSMEIAYLEGRPVRFPQVDLQNERRNLQRVDRLDEEVTELLNALGGQV